MAENVSNSIEKSPIGVDYDQESEHIQLSRGMAEWAGAPPPPPHEVGGAGSDPGWGLFVF